MSVIGRVGLAIAHPRAALAAADVPGAAGRAGNDLLIAILVAMIAVHARELVAAAWLAGEIDLGLGLRAAMDAVSRGLTVPLAALAIAAAACWLAAGRRRALGRAFDLGCVAVIPLIFVELAASLAIAALGLRVPGWASWAITGAGAAWGAAVTALAIAQARRDQPVTAPSSTGRRAGLGIAGVAVALLVVHAVWVVTHLDWLRPMRDGDPVPAFALPRIGPDGALGEPVRSEDLADTVVVLDFWAPWCGPCLRAMPALSALAKRHPGGDVVVLSVDLEDFAGARALFDAEGYAQLLVADAAGTAERFGVHEIPHLVVVDHGVVRLVTRGDGQLRRAIALAEELSGL